MFKSKYWNNFLSNTKKLHNYLFWIVRSFTTFLCIFPPGQVTRYAREVCHCSIMLREDLNPVTSGTDCLGCVTPHSETRHLNYKGEAKPVQITEGHVMQCEIESRPLHQVKWARTNQQCRRSKDAICQPRLPVCGYDLTAWWPFHHWNNQAPRAYPGN